MMEWESVLSEIIEMAKYFDGCAKNATGTARKKFLGYIKTLETVSELVMEQIDGEDDGK